MDQCLCVFQTQHSSLSPFFEAHAGSQITNLHWSPDGSALMTAHGSYSTPSRRAHASSLHRPRFLTQGSLATWNLAEPDEELRVYPVQIVLCSIHDLYHRILNSRVSCDFKHVFALLPQHELLYVMDNPMLDLGATSHASHEEPDTACKPPSWFDLQGQHLR